MTVYKPENPEKELADAKRTILQLRQVLAYEARVVVAQTMDLKSLSKGRRSCLRASIDRMADIAIGLEDDPYAIDRAYADKNYRWSHMLSDIIDRRDYWLEES